MSVRANVGLMIASFGVGQGALFIAQTYLLVNDALEFLGTYGLLFSTLILLMSILELGGNVNLARTVVKVGIALDSVKEYRALIHARVVLLILVWVLVGAYLALVRPGQFVTLYLASAVPGLSMYILSGAGMIEGLRKSGYNSCLTSLPYILTAVVLPFAAAAPDSTAGVVLGGAFSFSVVMIVGGQFIILRPYLLERWGAPPTLEEVKRSLSDGLQYLVAWTPSQALYRLQLAFITVFLGASAAGIFLYAKQIVNSMMQFTQFIRRAEYPALVDLLDGGTQSARALNVAFRNSTTMSTIGFVVLIVGAAAGRYFQIGQFGDVATLIAVYAAIVPASHVYASTKQICYAQRFLKGATLSSGLLLLLVCCGTILTIPSMGLYGVAIVEILSNLLAGTFIMLLLFLRRARGRSHHEGGRQNDIGL